MRIILYSMLLTGLFFTACTNENRSAGDPENRSAGDPEKRSDEQRVRPAAAEGTSAAYFTYTNPLAEPDTILSVGSTVSALTQIHETYETGDGMMGMRERHNLTVQPEETLVFEQGGLHVMLIRLEKDLSEGDSVTVTLQLSRAGKVGVKLPVKH